MSYVRDIATAMKFGQTFSERTPLMKTIGLIGGTSWESSLEYYRLLNEMTKERLGGLHSAKVLMYSVDFEPMERAMRSGDWEAVARDLTGGPGLWNRAEPTSSCSAATPPTNAPTRWLRPWTSPCCTSGRRAGQKFSDSV